MFHFLQSSFGISITKSGKASFSPPNFWGLHKSTQYFKSHALICQDNLELQKEKAGRVALPIIN